MSVPHFIHTPFYVYAYAFGDCLVNALYDEYSKAADKKDFTEKYIELLKSGGTKRHDAALAEFGLDTTDPAFWKKGMTRLWNSRLKPVGSWGVPGANSHCQTVPETINESAIGNR